MISLFEAGKMIHSGEWMTELAALDEIHSHSQQVISALSSDISSNRQSEVYRAQVEEAYEALGPLLDHAIRDVEHHYISYEPDLTEASRMELRIKPYVVFKTKPTVRETIIPGLGLILAVLVSTNVPVLFWTWVGLSIADLFGKLYSKWEVLKDPDERCVFEAVYRLQGKASVINYDALQRSDYENAYGILNPSEGDIHKEAGTKLSRRQLRKTLVALKRRGILEERKDRWSIQF